MLRAKAAVVLNTSNTAPDREARVFGDPIDTLWRNCIFGLCGIDTVYRETYSIVVTSSGAQRAQWLERTRALLRRAFPQTVR